MSPLPTNSDSQRHEDRRALLWQGLALGMGAAAFFSVSFVLNRQMAQSNGHWAWSSALRYLLMIPGLAVIITLRRQWRILWTMWSVSPGGWCAWGILSCALFYTPLAAACSLSPAWVVAATWPISIVLGILMGPLIYSDHRRVIPKSALFFSVLITLGVLLLQAGEMQKGGARNMLVSVILVLFSAAVHPIGNRRSMLILEKAGLPADPFLRLTLLIMGSMPVWVLLCGWGFVEVGWPSAGQLGTVGIVAETGLIATPLFFAACDRVSRNPAFLAAIEATQAAEIVFTLIFEALLLGIASPSPFAWVGMVLIATGFVLHALPRRAGQSAPSDA